MWARQALPLLLLLLVCPAKAQLARNFYYITRIESRVLPNAVQVTIRTDGVVQFGADLNEVFERDANGRFQPRATTRLRLRFLRARAKLPSFNEVGAYPVDGAYVSPGRDELQAPFINGSQDPDEPATDVELRFYVPVMLRKLNPYGASGDIGTDDDDNDSGFNFTEVLGARDVGIELGRDRRSVIITVISDRVDALQKPSLNRAPQRTNRRLNIKASAVPGEFRFDVLRQPLQRVLDTVSRVTGVPFLVRAESADTNITLLLPSATPREFIETLVRAYGLSLAERAPPDGETVGGAAVGGYEIGRGGDMDVSRRIVLNHLAPERARLLFPDFLLPRLRVDSERTSILATGSPALVERIAQDLEKLDKPHPQVKVEASVWEISNGESFDFALRAAYNSGTGNKYGGALDLGNGQASLVLDEAVAKSLSANLTALQVRNRARLAAKPYVVVASGETGTLFSGQNRFVTVLQRRSGQQNAQALKLQIGTSLTVTPLVGGTEKDSEILLQLFPEVSSIDEIEAGTGLPTISLRNVSTTMRVRPGETVLLAGLDSHIETKTRRGFFQPWPGRRDGKGRTALIFLVTATRAE
jgi:hypothetical protein